MTTAWATFEAALPYLMYAVPMVFVYAFYARRRRRTHEQSIATFEEAQAAGLTEPASLHPVIDESRCLGCKTCITACPEGEILGLVNGKAVLVEPTRCIGHGACREACPQDAITLVLGTETRGVEIPEVGPDFQTNVPGIFVAGELGGMGLIRNAIEQGRQAVAEIRPRNGARSDLLDLLIVGAGPAGFAASLAATQQGLRFETVEQDTLGGTVAHYPRGKLVMTQPAELPLYGKLRQREISKESLLEIWRDVERTAGLSIRYSERVESIERGPDALVVQTTVGRYQARNVLLAIGRRGTPRRLEVPGEELEKVVYRLVEPEQYRGRRVLVVGGGDSALEAALALADEPGTRVTLSYRSKAFSRAKARNREKLEVASGAGRLRVLLPSTVMGISETRVGLETSEGPLDLENDAVIVCAGGILPTGFLRECGIDVRTVHGAPIR